MLYNNKILELEKVKVQTFVQERAREKNYPELYLEKLYPLIEQMYEVTKLKNENVTISPFVMSVLKFSKESHNGQERRFINLPYIMHPMELATRLLLEKFSDDVIAGALLHDVVEDCNVSLDAIENQFNKQVAYYVYYLSDIAKPEEGNRKVRQDINFIHFSKSDWDTHNIKLVDLISNTRSLVICDPRFASVYLPELINGMDYFKEHEKKLSPNLLTMLQDIVKVSSEIMDLQVGYNIGKLESKKPKMQ
jgi:hypothetical protein